MPLSSQKVEHVLVVPTLLFHEIGYFQGFSENTEPYLKTLLDPSYTSFRPRDEVEQDPSYKQLIPYCIFRHGDDLFCYERGKTGGEDRLKAKRSIGIGGHISSTDGDEATIAYHEGMSREIAEEVYVESTYREQILGLINDDQNDVGRVHLGIVHVFDLDSPKVRPREESIIDTGFTTLSDCIRDRERFETWSQICLDYLVTKKN